MKKFLPLLLLAPLLFCGCSHDFEITNINTYTAGIPDHRYRDLNVLVTGSGSYNQTELLLTQRTAEAMAQLGGYRIFSTQHATGDLPDVQVRLSMVKWEKDGSTGNFFVCWPGFILFTHAWLGYYYESNFTVQCELIDTSTQDTIETFIVELPLEIRHAEFDRTWGNGMGWLFFYTLPAAVNGIVCTGYDPDLTEIIHERAFPIISKELAMRIVQRINALPWTPNGNYSY